MCGVEFKPQSSQHRYCPQCSETLQKEHKRKFTQQYRNEGREDRSSWSDSPSQSGSKELRRGRWQQYYNKYKEIILSRIKQRRYEQGQHPGQRSDEYWENRYHLIYELGLPCVVCGAREDLHVHHVVAVEDEGTDDLENLVVLCETHHIGSGTGFHSLGAEEFERRYGVQFKPKP